MPPAPAGVAARTSRAGRGITRGAGGGMAQLLRWAYEQRRRRMTSSPWRAATTHGSICKGIAGVSSWVGRRQDGAGGTKAGGHARVSSPAFNILFCCAQLAFLTAFQRVAGTTSCFLNAEKACDWFIIAQLFVAKDVVSSHCSPGFQLRARFA